MQNYNLLDTQALKTFIDSQKSLKERYNRIVNDYNRIVNDLLNDWKGKGADAFQEDSETVATNIVGIQDILNTMCDTLRDCCDIFEECDTSLGSSNRESISKE